MGVEEKTYEYHGTEPPHSDNPAILIQIGVGIKHVPAWGHTAVDFERRVDHDRLRRYRLSAFERRFEKVAMRLAA